MSEIVTLNTVDNVNPKNGDFLVFRKKEGIGFVFYAQTVTLGDAICAFQEVRFPAMIVKMVRVNVSENKTPYPSE